MPNTFGHLFRVTTFGESHGEALGVVIDGCPAGLSISMEKIQKALDRRRPGQSLWTTSRNESDKVICVSGIENAVTLGTPIVLLINNENKKPKDYEDIHKIYRPSHADFTTEKKYGLRPQSGGGRASARETVARVAAAALAEQVLHTYIPDLQVLAYVSSIKNIEADVDPTLLTREKVDAHALRCPDIVKIPAMEDLILTAKQAGDSVGGCIRCHVFHCPIGLGEPVFDKLHADLAKALMSIPAAKGFEIGSGFASCLKFGSENNDAFVKTERGISTLTNHSGGVQGGISNGESIDLKVGFKAPSTIFKMQQTVNVEGENVDFTLKKGRHDPCVLPRAVPIVEAMVILVLTDHWLRQQVTRL